MTNGQNVARARHLEELANAAKRYTLREIMDVTEAVTAELENISISGGSSSSSDGIVLPTVASAVDGGLWYEVTDNSPMIYLRQGNYAYGFNYDTLKFVGTLDDALVAYLKFDASATADVCGNTWATTGNVAIDTTIKKFGAGSVHLPSAARLTASNIFDVTAEKWTFDTWMYVVTQSSFFALGSGNGSTCEGYHFGSDQILLGEKNNAYWPAQQKFTPTLNTWHHVAVVKNGNTVLLFNDGTLLYSWEHTSDAQGGNLFYLGGSPNGYWGSDIYLDNVRIFNGVALWTENFTPPTAADYV